MSVARRTTAAPLGACSRPQPARRRSSMPKASAAPAALLATASEPAPSRRCPAGNRGGTGHQGPWKACERARAYVWEMILGGEVEGRGRPSAGQKRIPMRCGPTQGMAERTGCALLPARRPSMPNRMSCAECGRGREPASCAVHRKHQAEPVPMTTPRTRAAAGCERDSPPRSSRSPAPATKLFGTCATKQQASLRCHPKHPRGIEMALKDIPMERQRTGGRRSTCRLGSC